MKRNYKTIVVRGDVYDNFKIIEKIIRRHHPELDGVPLALNKLIIELQKFYGKGQKENNELRFENV